MSADQRDRLGAAVTAAEQGTSVEIVVAIAEACDNYALFPLLWATAIGFVLAGGLAVIWPEMHIRFAFLCTGAVVLALFFLLHWQPLRIHLVPPHARHDHAIRAAKVHFANQVAGRTIAANGLLIFVALAERYAAIIPDAGIVRIVPADTWNGIIAALTVEIARGRLTEGVEAAIASSGAILAPLFPRHAGDHNQIPDAVIFTKE